MEDKGIIVGKHRIGRNQQPFIVAEMSGNHNQSLERALAIVDAAASAGVHALKIQTFTADTMTLDLDSEGFSITDTGSLWKGTTLYKLYQQAHTPKKFLEFSGDHNVFFLDSWQEVISSISAFIQKL